ncbi:glycosyltransferase family 9 protein [Methylophaga sp.]|uniref:glycosyltransferase family 9 protein n=1 Tax=Methylophaga sp. TaxID=2024840 RepID=UPI0027288E6A|nr:glycosyltransferase family 9 protein [Methylophaga sp.]MDO8826451.1 glycosyltransferase family 9 protein [Methylophaga sp.]
MNNSSTAQLAIVSFESLGDSLIYIMMADNLRRNGYTVMLFGNVPYQLKNWLPELAIQPYPQLEDLYSTLNEYHLVLMSPSRAIRNATVPITLEDIRQRYLLICQKVPDEWSFDHQSRLEQSLSPEVFQQLGHLSHAAGSIRYREFEKESVVEITLDFMREKMGLQNLSANVQLSPPQGLVYRKNRRRIILSPDSAWPEKKDWTPERFLKLGKLLEQSGYEPVIVVAPDNHEVWQTMVNNRFPTLTFETIDKLAEYIYESGAVIANDSGNGHLASFLGIPVITIYRKRNPYFHWRPDWSAVKVVCPIIVLPGFNGPIWRPFVGVKRVKNELEKLLMRVEKS